MAGTRVFCCDSLVFSGDVRMQRKHTLHVIRSLPELMYWMLSQVSSMKICIDSEIAAMRALEFRPTGAHHLLIEAVGGMVPAAVWLPMVIHECDEPQHDEFRRIFARSQMNAFTELAKHRSPPQQIEESLRLSSRYRRELSFNWFVIEAAH